MSIFLAYINNTHAGVQNHESISHMTCNIYISLLAATQCCFGCCHVVTINLHSVIPRDGARIENPQNLGLCQSWVVAMH